MRRFLTLGLGVSFLASLLMLLVPMSASAAFNKNRVIDDNIYNDYGSMTATGIDAFLNSFPNSCISTNNKFAAPDPTGYAPNTSYTYGGPVSAGSIIYHAAQAYKLNPKVILTTLQKEQSLVVGDAGCTKLRYVGAMGNGCPDGGSSYNYSGFELYRINNVPVTSVNGTCVNNAASVGFSRQVITATWKLKFFQQRSLGNVDWAEIHGSWNNSDDPPTCYKGLMTQGYRSRIAQQYAAADCPYKLVYFDGNYTIDSTAVHMDTGGTAALYYYTPHLHGNQLFVDTYEGWFGSTVGPCEAVGNISGASGRSIINNQISSTGPSNLTFVRLNNTGSACVEAHSWSQDFHSWVAHVPTNLRALLPNNIKIVSGNMRGDKRDELMLIKLASGGGKVEVHMWDNTYQNWLLRTATVASNIDPSQGTVTAGDMNGDGVDELLYLRYNGSGGRLEVHTFSSDFHSWAGHALTSLSGFDPTKGEIITGDMNGDGRDELLFVKYDGHDGRVEVHTWDKTYHTWAGHALTSLSGFDPTKGEIITGDMNGDGRDELLYVKYQAGSGRVEVHIWGADYHSWAAHYLTNMPAFDPAS